MALNFAQGAETEKVDCGSDTSLDNLDPQCYIAWVQFSAFEEFDCIMNKFVSPPRNNSVQLVGASGDNIRHRRVFSGTNHNYITNDTPLSLNTWHCVCAQFDSVAPSLDGIFVGSLTTAMTESTYSANADPDGTISSDAGDALNIGNTGGDNNAMEGDIAVAAVINRTLTLGEMQDWQFYPRVIADTKLFMHLGYNGTGTQPDWSGNGNHGTVTGAVVSDHVPLGPPFGFDLGWQGFAGAGAPPVIPLPPLLMRHPIATVRV